MNDKAVKEPHIILVGADPDDADEFQLIKIFYDIVAER